MKLEELFEAIKPIPSDYDAEYAAILKKYASANTWQLPTHLKHLNRRPYVGPVISTSDLKQELAKLPDEDIILFIKSNPSDFQYVPKPSDAVIKFALRHDGINLKYLPKMGIPMTDEYIKIAVRSNGRAIGWVDNPTEDQMIRAVSKTSQAIHNIMKPYSKKITPGVVTSRVIATASKKNSGAAANVLIKHEQLDDDAITAAIKKHPHAILHIKHPTPEQISMALELAPRLFLNIIRKGWTVPEHVLSNKIKIFPEWIYDLALHRRDLVTNDMIKHALTNPKLINMPIRSWGGLTYDMIVKVVFKDNNLLMKKWLRYGETMRNQS